MIRNPLLALTSTIVLFASGCATIFSKSSDEITIDSNPQGALVSFAGEKVGRTPVSITVERDTFEKKVITISRDGYETQEFALKKSFNGASLFNLGFITTTTGLTSWGIDMISGKLIEYRPRRYMIDLKENESQAGVGNDVDSLKIAFMVKNFNAVMEDVSKGDGKHLAAYYSIDRKKEITYTDFLIRIQSSKNFILSQEDGVELFRAVEANTKI